MTGHSGVANLPLHGGHAPRWLFHRMVKLSGAITEAIIYEYGTNEFIRRISNPYWFQALSCVLGFDWHSSGTTTTTCGALKTSLDPEKHGIFIAGGKGRASRRTPQEIEEAGDLFSLSTKKIEELVYSSKISAKIDNSCIQDNYQLYHHVFVLTENADWAVIQQGMNETKRYARRYHWLSDSFTSYLNDPHAGICCDHLEIDTLDMAATKSNDSRITSLDLVLDGPEHLKKYFRRKKPSDKFQTQLYDFGKEVKNEKMNSLNGLSRVNELNNSNENSSNKLNGLNTLNTSNVLKINTSNELIMPAHHPVLDIDLSDRDFEVLQNAWEIQPENYQELISLQGMGPKKIRALALISDLVYGDSPSWKDPVKYSFTHGGKDGYPYPVDREVYDNSIDTLRVALEQARLDKKDRYQALKRLEKIVN